MAPRVFVSYVHESERHQADVLEFATFLRGHGVDAVLDVWSAGARHDWYAWAIREMTAADHVIVVASPTYRAVGDGSAPADRHRGVQSEATLLRDLVYGDRVTWTPKVLPVLLPGHRVDEIPHFLSPHTASHYQVTAYSLAGAEDLLRVVHGRPGHVPPPVLPPPELPARSPVAVTWCADLPQHVDLRPGRLELHLVPGDQVGPHSADDMRDALAEAMDRTSRSGGELGLRPGTSGTSDSMSWSGTGEAGLAVLATGQRSAWYTPADPLPDSRLATELRTLLTLLADLALARPASWVPAASIGETRHVGPRSADHVVRSAGPAEDLAAALLAGRRAVSPEGTRVANVISGNVTGTVIQAGDIHGGVRF